MKRAGGYSEFLAASPAEEVAPVVPVDEEDADHVEPEAQESRLSRPPSLFQWIRQSTVRSRKKQARPRRSVVETNKRDKVDSTHRPSRSRPPIITASCNQVKTAESLQRRVTRARSRRQLCAEHRPNITARRGWHRRRHQLQRLRVSGPAHDHVTPRRTRAASRSRSSPSSPRRLSRPRCAPDRASAT